MSPPTKHALLSASSAARWLLCTAAPHFEAQFLESTSEYAEEGSLAHAICELKAVYCLKKQLTKESYIQKLNLLKQNPIYNDEIDRTSDIYIQHLKEKIKIYKPRPNIAIEAYVDFSDYVPEGFGTCDCIIVGNNRLDIIDYKHGKGVAVEAKNNPQMRLYALGALKRYKHVYGNSIENVRMAIDQPRINAGVSEETITVSELISWGKNIKPLAQKAFNGTGEFKPGKHCRFCRGNAQCKARANTNITLQNYIDKSIDKLTNTEISELLIKGKELVAWYKDLKAYALNAILKGENIPEFKVVAGRSTRIFSDPDAAIAAAIKAGYSENDVYNHRPKTLAELEKLMGKAEFENNLGAFVVKPLGTPTLVSVNDKRVPYNSAEIDFAGVIK
ncbi:MAG: DUF2800 domain-containing protein [Clostridia bacterium]|nr:DUF2800 domain-containing protein [Clostridia bacterium]